MSKGLDFQILDARSEVMAKFDKLIEQADGIEQELVYAHLNRDEANAKVKALMTHISRLRDRIGHWNAGHVRDEDLMSDLVTWMRTDLTKLMQEATNAIK